MKTRRSLSNIETVASTDNSDTPSKRRSLSRIAKTPTSTKKEVKAVTSTAKSRVISEGNSESSLPPNVYNSPVVRVLRSRVVTSDTEDEVKSCRTPKRRLSRGSLKEEKPGDTENDKISAKAEGSKTPESSKKTLSRKSLFSIVETEENEDTAKSVTSVGDEKVMSSSDKKEELMEEESSESKNVDRPTPERKEAVKTPTSSRKRSSLPSERKETPSKVEEKKKEKTPKSSGERFSVERSFQMVGMDEKGNRLNITECVVSLKDDVPLKLKASPLKIAEEFDPVKSSVITSDNTVRDGDSSDTNEECKTEDGMTEEKTIETDYVEMMSKSRSKQRVKTPASAGKRSSLRTESIEVSPKVDDKVKTPKSGSKKTERTPASAGKRSSLRTESIEVSPKVDDKMKTPKSGSKKTERTPASAGKRSSLITDSIETSSMVDDKVKTPKSGSKKTERTPASAKKTSSFIKDSTETPSTVEGKKDNTPKSSGKRSSLKSYFPVVELDETKGKVNTTVSAISVKDGAVKHASSPKEEFDSPKSSVITSDNTGSDGDTSDTHELVAKDRIVQGKSSETKFVDTMSKSESTERVKTPASVKKRSSLITDSKETPSKFEGKMEKTPKSSGKRSSLKSYFQVIELDETKDKVNKTESVTSLKDDVVKHASSPEKELDSQISSVITSDNLESDADSSDTSEEKITKDRVKDDRSSESEHIDSTSKYGSKERVKTPASAKKRQSLIRETPSKVESKEEKTPKSSGKRSLKSYFQVELNETKGNTSESVISPKVGVVKLASSPKKMLDSQNSSVITRDNVESDEDSSDTDEELTVKDKVVEGKSPVTKFVDTKSKSGVEERVKTPPSAKKRSPLITGSKEAPSQVEKKKKSSKSSGKRLSQKSVQSDEDSSDTDEELTAKDKVVEGKSPEAKFVDTKSKSGVKERVKTPPSAKKRSPLITGSKEAPSQVEKKSPKSSGKRSFQNSFQAFAMKDDEEEDSSDSEGQEQHQDPSTSNSESDNDTSSSSKESEGADDEETADDVINEDKITEKSKVVKMSPNVSRDSREFLVQKAMAMTSLAIQKEKKKLNKTPPKSEKMFVEATPEDESSEDSEDLQTEEVTKQTEVVEENDSDSGSDSDDDMPESMSFDTGKEQMNKAVQMAVDAIRREKERVKEQKRRRIEMIRTQKKEKEQRQMEKLKILEMKMPKRLSDDIVSRLPDAPAIPTIKAAKEKKKKSEWKVEDMVTVKPKKNKIIKFDDYIPLEYVKAPTKFGIVPMDVMQKIPKSASEKAAEFKRQALFGSRIRREPSKNLLSYKQKLGSAFKSKEVNQHQRFKPY